MRTALRLLPPLAKVEAVSALYESPPQPPAPPPAYLNAVARITTELTPQALLRHLKQIERDIGRRSAERWAPRPIDLDIVIYDDLVLESDALTIPHPRIAQRAFVLQPLLDLDPDLTLPGDGSRIEALLVALGDGSELVQVEPAGWRNG